MFGSNYCFLTCIQVSQEAGKVVWYSHLFKNFPQFVVIHTVKVFSVVNEAEVHIFLELSCFLHNPTDVGNLTSHSSAFPQSILNIWKLLVHLLLKPSLKDFEHYFASMWNECNCAVVWTCFDIALLWDWNENWSFPVLWSLLSFPNWLPYWVQHIHSITAVDICQMDRLLCQSLPSTVGSCHLLKCFLQPHAQHSTLPWPLCTLRGWHSPQTLYPDSSASLQPLRS